MRQSVAVGAQRTVANISSGALHVSATPCIGRAKDCGRCHDLMQMVKMQQMERLPLGAALLVTPVFNLRSESVFAQTSEFDAPESERGVDVFDRE